MTWPSATLSELCDINVGRTPARANRDYWGTGEPWLSIADMNQGRHITRTKEQITSAAAAAGHQVASGTVLLSFKLSIGKVAKTSVPLYTNEAIAALPIKRTDLIIEDFLMRALEHADLASNSNRAAMGATLNKAKLKLVPIPLPPLPEQRRIVAILDHADALRAKRRHVLTHLDTLTQSIFHDMFGTVIPDAFVDDVAEVQGGLQISTKRASFPVTVPYLRVANAHRGHLDLSEVKALQATDGEIARTQLECGDLLFVEGHANPHEVGRVAMWANEIETCVHQNHLIRGRLDRSRALPIFALSWLNSERGATHFRRASRTTSGLNTISAATVRSAPLPLPPMNSQQAFADRVTAVRGEQATARQMSIADDELFTCLQSRAFRGEL